MHVVLIETSGNQRYIFATNKLRENVGASELTYRVGTQWTLEADESLAHLWPKDEDAAQLRQNLLNQQPISLNGNSVEVIVATSGKAMLLVDNRETAKTIIQEVTSKALKQAPGLDVCGTISDHFDWNQNPLGMIVRATHEKLDYLRANRPSAALRFLRLPVVRECATSGLPAAEWDSGAKGGEPPAARSRISLCKRNNVDSYRSRMRALLRRHAVEGNFARDIGVLEKHCDWLAVVHADGNGVGQIFLDFWENSGCSTRKENNEAIKDLNRYYVNRYREFSIALDICTEEAFIAALRSLVERKEKLRSLQSIEEKRQDALPILPIVLGGDDLTVMCDGQAALQFTRDFLAEFERQTGRLQTDNAKLQNTLIGVIPPIARTALGISRLSACAGAAIIKPHYPFSAAYDLAEQLIRSAKTMKPNSTLDFHALYDASGSDLDRIREELQVDEGKTWLYARPYVVTPIQSSRAEPHAWEKLEARLMAIFARDDDGRRRLPNSQLHDLRGGLFLGKVDADARYRLIRQRYIEQGIAEFDETDDDLNNSLFFNEEIGEIDGNKKDVHRTRLLDALDAANFWVEEDQEAKNGNKEDAQ